jgi:hypothetical protein
MRDPLGALEAVASVTNELLVVETLTDMNFTRRPAAAFYPGSYMVGDSSNWWGPNEAATVAMLEEVGFTNVQAVNRPTFSQRLRTSARNVANVTHSRLSRSRTTLPLGYIATDRAIVQARR